MVVDPIVVATHAPADPISTLPTAYGVAPAKTDYYV
jgi:hypothetical protein